MTHDSPKLRKSGSQAPDLGVRGLWYGVWQTRPTHDIERCGPPVLPKVLLCGVAAKLDRFQRCFQGNRPPFSIFCSMSYQLLDIWGGLSDEQSGRGSRLLENMS